MNAEEPPVIRKLISGGQTGVDRGALDAAIAAGIPHGGWCPRGRLAENGRIPRRYKLRETRSSEYRVRTELNVIDSDGTLIFYRGKMSGGTALTRRLAAEHGKPCLPIDLEKQAGHGESILRWIKKNQVQVLNVAGPRENSAPEIAAEVREFLKRILTGLADGKKT